MKVIASSVRKGNILDLDGQLYVVLKSEKFHPGKGTPTTSIDMRRISDGVKTMQRYKTTDQVERAHVEDHKYSYLYQDGDGFHFINQDNYEQVQVPEDVIGDQAVYLQEGMEVMLSVHEGNPVAIELPQKVTLEVLETEPVVKGQTASGSFTRRSCQTAFAPWCRPTSSPARASWYRRRTARIASAPKTDDDIPGPLSRALSPR